MVLGCPSSSHSQGVENNLLKAADENLNSSFSVGSPTAFELPWANGSVSAPWAPVPGVGWWNSVVVSAFCEASVRQRPKKQVRGRRASLLAHSSAGRSPKMHHQEGFGPVTSITSWGYLLKSINSFPSSHIEQERFWQSRTQTITGYCCFCFLVCHWGHLGLGSKLLR